MQTTKKKPSLIFILVGAVLSGYLGYLINGAWTEGIAFNDFMNRFNEVCAVPFANYYNSNTVNAVAIALCIYAMAIIMYYTSQRNYMPGKEYGTARFENPKQVNKILADKDENFNRILSQNVKMSLDFRKLKLNGNILICGGSGAGKTFYEVKPNLMQMPHNCSFICTDPKGEILRSCGQMLKDNGYNVKVINLLEMDKSDCYNPFSYIREETDVVKLITNLISNTTPKGSTPSDPFWEKAEGLFLQAIFYYVWLEVQPAKRNFETVLKLLGEAEVKEPGKASKLDVRMKFLEESSPLGANHPAVKQYNKCMRGAGDTVRSIIISANSRLAFLENKQVLRLLSKDELNLSDIGIGVNGDGETKTALFCVIPDSDKSYNFIIGMLYTQIFQELYYQADFNCGGRLPIHVTFMLDEFANVALPDDFCSLLSTMRSREISSIIIIQNFAQLKALFKDTWETIPGNCDTFIYLGGNEQSTHKYVSELLGKGTIDKKSSGETKGRQGSSSRNYDVLGRELFTPDEVRKLDNKKCIICNNQYGLTEYTLSSADVKVSYKNRNGERAGDTVSWREVYEILSYMVKQPFYCGEDQKAIYQTIKNKIDREKMNPVYRKFFDIEDSVRESRLKTRERAIAYGLNTKIDTDGRIISDEDKNVSADISQNDTEPQEAAPETPAQEVLPPAEGLRGKEKTQDQTKLNFHYNLWETEKGGVKTRYQWNIDAICTLKQIEAENRLATQEEQTVLSKFVGWGGLSQAFDENNAGWTREYAELKELLSDEEYSAARATVNNAFYTSPEIAMCINSALVQFGFKGGNVLEPSMGIGNFFGSMPAPMQQSKLYGVELDSISGRIAKQLYQNANISITGFENTTYPDNFFDVVMGNVPFGDYKIFDPKYNKYNFRIHDYFLAKALDQARPGGMVAVITTKGTLDKSNPTIRKYLAERAELVGAIRLPNTAFKDNAGTEVTADILFLQKRERKIDIEPDWVHLGVTGDGIAVNSYFAEHPEMMLGTMQYDTRMFGQDSRYTVCVNNDENFNLYEALNKAICNIRAQMTDFERLADNEEQTEEVIPADPDVRNYTYTFFEGKLYYRENSEMVRQKVSPTAEERIKSLDEIRQITRELIDIQMEGCSDEELADKQQLLNVKYDKFVGKYGAITSKANRTAFRDDSDYPLLCSLEEVNEDGEVKKADMFYKQTIKAKSVVDRVETAVEALNVSVNEFGYVNIPYMLSIYEADRDTLIKELDGIIFLNPDRYNENKPFLKKAVSSALLRYRE